MMICGVCHWFTASENIRFLTKTQAFDILQMRTLHELHRAWSMEHGEKMYLSTAKFLPYAFCLLSTRALSHSRNRALLQAANQTEAVLSA